MRRWSDQAHNKGSADRFELKRCYRTPQRAASSQNHRLVGHMHRHRHPVVDAPHSGRLV